MNQATAKIKIIKRNDLFLDQKKRTLKLEMEIERLKGEVIYWMKKLRDTQDDYIELLEKYNRKVSPSNVLKIVRD